MTVQLNNTYPKVAAASERESFAEVWALRELTVFQQFVNVKNYFHILTMGQIKAFATTDPLHIK